MAVMGVLHLTAWPAMLIFHGILVAHYLLLRRFSSLSAISSASAVMALFFYSLVVSTDIPFVTIFMRVAAVLFSMQIVRLQIDPDWIAVVQRSSLVSYLLSVISFGPAEKSVFAVPREALSMKMVLNEAFFMLLKYLLINAIHIYFYFYPYRRDPVLRGFLPLEVHSFMEYYVLALQLFLYMSFYYAFSFGLFALICGKLSPPLFNAPVFMTSPREFWSKRWNMLFKQCLHDLIFIPTLRLIELLFPTASTVFVISSSTATSSFVMRKSRSPSRFAPRQRHSVSPTRKDRFKAPLAPTPSPPSSYSRSSSVSLTARHPIGALVAGQMTFLFSGVMHEYFMTVIFELAPTWEHMIFFNLHGILCLAQVLLERSLPRSFGQLVPDWIGTLFTTLLFLFIAPLFFNTFLRVDALNEFHLPLLLPLYDKWCLSWIHWPTALN